MVERVDMARWGHCDIVHIVQRVQCVHGADWEMWIWCICRLAIWGIMCIWWTLGHDGDVGR